MENYVLSVLFVGAAALGFAWVLITEERRKAKAAEREAMRQAAIRRLEEASYPAWR